MKREDRIALLEFRKFLVNHHGDDYLDLPAQDQLRYEKLALLRYGIERWRIAVDAGRITPDQSKIDEMNEAYEVYFDLLCALIRRNPHFLATLSKDERDVVENFPPPDPDDMAELDEQPLEVRLIRDFVKNARRGLKSRPKDDGASEGPLTRAVAQQTSEDQENHSNG